MPSDTANQSGSAGDRAYYHQLQAAINALERMHGAEALDGLVRVLQLARQQKDWDTLAEYAMHLVRAGSHYGRFDLELQGLGEIHRLYEADGRYADLRDQVILGFKWIAERVPEHVEISRADVEGFFDRMESFYRREKTGLRPLYQSRCRTAAFMGYTREADHYRSLWRKSPKHDQDDCPACETDARVQYLLCCGRPHKALKAAGPVLDGRQWCDGATATFARLLLYKTLSGEPDVALRMAMFSRRKLRHQPGLLAAFSDHVMFLSIIGMTEMARRTVWVVLARDAEATNPYIHFCVARAMWLYFARMEGSGQVTFPRRTELAGQTMTAKSAAAFYGRRAHELAKAFDARNGTTLFATRLASVQSLIKLGNE